MKISKAASCTPVHVLLMHADLDKPTQETNCDAKRSSPRCLHPPYMEMIKEAIVTLKDPTGSSRYAIAKFIQQNQKSLPANFKPLFDSFEEIGYRREATEGQGVLQASCC